MQVVKEIFLSFLFGILFLIYALSYTIEVFIFIIKLILDGIYRILSKMNNLLINYILSLLIKL
jgi:hypothetical protein